jgi:hypothetical protein
MANAFYNRGASFNPDELADGDAIEAEFDAVGRGFDTIEDLVNINKAGYPTQTFHVAPATQPTHAVQKAQLDLKLDAVNYNATDILTKIKTVDGSVSGLDADLLDGLEASQFIRSDTADNITGALTSTSTISATQFIATSNGAGTNFRVGDDAWFGDVNISNAIRLMGYQDNTKGYLIFGNGDSTALGRSGTGALTYGGNTIWHAGNDGSGSGLDADLLDGQDGAYYRNASNINAGTIGDAYIPATISSSITGNAATASTLQTARTINSVSFNGSANITVEPYIETDSSSASRYLTFVDSVTAGYQRLNMDSGLTYNPSTNVLTCSVSGNASTASKLATARTISLTGGVTGSVAFDGSTDATITAALSNAGVLASVATSAAGGVGTYVFGRYENRAFAVDLEEGKTYAGSSIKPAAMQRTTSTSTPAIYGGFRSAANLTGTWRAMGGAEYSEINYTLFVRIS